MNTFPLAVQTTYQDLLEAHKMQAVSAIGGTPLLKHQGTQASYWYARQRIGDRVVDRYIGRDTPELRKRIKAAEKQREDQRTLAKRNARLVAQLRAAGLPALDRQTGKVLNAMAQIGTFRLGGTLVGTHAFRLYSAELGVSLTDTLAVTEDVDIAAFEGLKLVIHDQVNPSLANTFRDLKLAPAPGLDRRNRPTRWAMPGGGTMVDFLAPKMRDSDDVLMLQPLGVYAQTHSFLNFLIAEPIRAVALYRSGILVQIPQPERYAIHKLIVAQRRATGSEAKARKDLAQAELLIRILAEDRPHVLEEAFEHAMAAGPEWRAAIGQSLRQKPLLAELMRPGS
ncbi:MAG: GSU2403 family nucleotidyltransferase fold protein [Rhodospirillales bacterium]|nr:GSU2403 family nucleotidyltransferase fold protein [Rhodospirillales bacterium]